MSDFLETLKSYIKIDGSNLSEAQKQNLKQILGLDNNVGNIGNQDLQLNGNRYFNLKSFFLNFFSNSGTAKVGINKNNPETALHVVGGITTDDIKVKKDGKNLSLAVVDEGLNNETYNKEQIQQMVETDFKGTISPTDAAPTVEGSYKPTIAGTYTNLGGLVAKEGYDTLFYFNGTTWSKSEVEMPSVQVAPIFDATNKDDAQGGKQIVNALQEVIIFKGSNIAEKLETNTENSANAEPSIFLLNDGSEVGSGGYFVSDFILIEDLSLKYSTTLGSAIPAICVYDLNKVFLSGKNASELTDTSTTYTERLLDDDFDLTNAKYVRISSQNGSEIKVTYNVDVLVNNTLSVIDRDSEKAINSKAIEPLENDILAMKKIASDVELLNNYTPYIEMANSFMRGHFGSASGEAPNKTINCTRNRNYQFTVNTADITGMSNGTTAFVINDGVNVKPYRGVINASTGVFKSFDLLPASFTTCQTLWGDGIHLSRLGYKALAEWFAKNLDLKLNQRKNKMFGIYSYDETLTQNNQHFVRDGVTLLEMTKLTGSTVSGGWINQSEGVPGTFSLQYPQSTSLISSKYANYWMMTQNIADAGVRFILNGGVDGYVRIICGLDFKEDVITGKVNVKAISNGVEIYNENLENYGLEEITIPITTNYENITVEISLLSNEATRFTIDVIEVINTYLSNENPLKKNNLKVMFMCDSWGCFPNLESGESPALRPDGSSLQGLAYFPNHFRNMMEAQGYDIEVYNFSRGNQTSKWGDYWAEEFIDRCPSLPDYCIINFFINDCNSEPNIAGNTPSNYDFSPTDPYSYQMSDAGGVFASTTKEDWFKNINSICRKLRNHGITPIVLGYPQLGGLNLEFAKRNVKFLNN